MSKITGTVALRALFFMALLKVVAFCKVNLLTGPFALFFSATHSFMPLTGAFGGLMTTAAVIGMSTIAKVIFGVSYAPCLITYHIPSFIASAYWAYDHWLVRVMVPVLCMILFIVHPVGFSASPYTLYWIIPIVIYFFNMRTIFASSLGSTMVAHAVGSVIWLYTVPMTAEQWYSLIPVVALERLLFALGMTAAYYALSGLWVVQDNILGLITRRFQCYQGRASMKDML
ncbi:hypothetical protein KJZ61_01935 [Candidatus Dependentiae bacterium]|nr:hypothetical protein [Candidatus Dependentiae bacterium]